MTDVTVAALADLVGGRVVGDGERVIKGLGDLRTAGPDRIGFVRAAQYQAAAATTRAGAVIVAEELDTEASQVVVQNVDVAFAKVALHFHPMPRAIEHRVHERAVVDPAARVEQPVRIDANATVGKSRVGRGTVIMAGSAIADDCVIGQDCVLHQNVTLYPGTRLGNRVIVHSGTVVGSDGFGYAHEGATWIKVPQLGGTVIEDDVEIGAGCTIDLEIHGACAGRSTSRSAPGSTGGRRGTPYSIGRWCPR
jgi:UDP-3-O-[3-hydroxymyristoyl] glucosamine N-acyltransferase